MLADYGYRADIIQPLKNGVILGKRDQEAKTLSWNAVPYAQPPVGDLRWKAPRTLGNWDGVLETRDFGNKSLQINGLNIIGSEDCLYLNIWRPDSEEENLPVLVWAHGGGNILGSGEDFPGDILARETNCIIISLNYWLGILDCISSNISPFFSYSSVMYAKALVASASNCLINRNRD